MNLLRISLLVILLLFGFSYVQAKPTKPDGYCGDDYKTSGFYAFSIDAFFAFDENNLIISCSGKLARLDMPDYILTSNNGGKNWTKRLELDKGFIRKFMFLDNKIGFAVGGDFPDNIGCKGLILKTTDGGLTWKKVQIEISECLEDIQFLDKMSGWSVSDAGNFLKTTDSGKSWTIINQKLLTKRELLSVNLSLSDNNSSWAITFEREFNKDRTEAVIDGDIYQTADGGKTWLSRKDKFINLLEKYKPEEIRFQAMKFINAKTGYVAANFLRTEYNQKDKEKHIVVEGGVIFSTKNGGKSWETNIITTELGLTHADFSASGKFWVIPMRVWQKDFILSSLDYGKSWEHISTKFTDGGTPNQIHFLNNKIGFLIADLGNNADDLYRTLDGGKTWELR